MPAQKRARKKAARKGAKKTSARKPATQNSKRGIKRFLVATTVTLLLICITLMTSYSFGSFDLRARMDQSAATTVRILRMPAWMPGPIKKTLNTIYDKIPGSEGFSVDGGELGREESHFIARQPRCAQPVQLIRNRTYYNLFSAEHKQPLCIAMRLVKENSREDPERISFLYDSRVPNLDPLKIEQGNWRATSLATAAALTEPESKAGSKKAGLYSTITPMPEAFRREIWQNVIEEFALNYPRRFDEIWLYLGPILNERGTKLASGVTLPDGYYVIAFDLTEAGGLRALSLIIPTDAENKGIKAYLSSINEIEQRTGLVFLPGLEPHVRHTLAKWKQHHLW